MDQFFLVQNCPLSVLLPPSLFLLMVLDSKVHGQISLFGLDPPTHETLKIVLGFQRLLVTATQGGIKCGNRGTGFLDSEDPKHTLFCRETAFVAIYALFKG